MQGTFVAAKANSLAKVGERRCVYQLSKQLVEICWDYYVLQLRTIDLLVLRSELKRCLNSVCIEQNEDYILTINDIQLYLDRADLRSFHALICAATEQLPTQVIRWHEVTLSLSPYAPRLVRRHPLKPCQVFCPN